MTDAHDPIRSYVTNTDRPVFALRNLPEEVVAVLFAYYSRSTDTLRDNLRRLVAEGDLELHDAPDDAGRLSSARDKARQFHEKWVVGYGHSSVAEHAVVHLAIEDVSIVASKVIEDNRLASYTEKSTRYVPFDADSYVREAGIAGSPDAARYDEVCRHLLGTYDRLMPEVTAQIEQRFARPEDWPERRYRSVCRAKACDLLRYLLPAATRTNLGLTINGRALEHLLTKLYSHPLAELRELAEALRGEAVEIVPTLIKYAEVNPYLVETRAALSRAAHRLLDGRPEPAEGNRVRLVRAPADPVSDLAAAVLYEHAQLDYDQVSHRVAELTPAERLALVADYVARRGRHDQPLRALEHAVYTFEVLVDFGAYRDIQRHRMCTQTAQTLTCEHGYETPPELVEMGHGAVYHEALARSAEAHGELAARHGLEAAQYVLPLAWRKQVLITWSLRELHHFISLRSGRQGHVSYRRVAQDCWRELRRVHPELAEQVRVDLSDYDLARA